MKALICHNNTGIITSVHTYVFMLKKSIHLFKLDMQLVIASLLEASLYVPTPKKAIKNYA